MFDQYATGIAHLVAKIVELEIEGRWPWQRRKGEQRQV
jgi:hypothetical protein